MSLARAKNIVVIGLALGSCHGSTSCIRVEETRNVAVGWRGSVTALLSVPCTPVAPHPTKVVAIGSGYEAVATGTEDFTCGESVMHVRVASAAAIAIEFPASIFVSDRSPLVVFGDDGRGGKLDLGGQYVETLSGVLERAGCGDMDFMCSVGGELLIARTPGRGGVTVTFRGLTATRDVVAIARPDAGAD